MGIETRYDAFLGGDIHWLSREESFARYEGYYPHACRKRRKHPTLAKRFETIQSVSHPLEKEATGNHDVSRLKKTATRVVAVLNPNKN